MRSIQIEYFLKVAEKLNITEAANELYISQPAVSRQIILLEKELGVVLFSRTSQGVALTLEGQQIYQFFTQQNFAFEELLKEIKKQSELPDIAIGIQDGLDYSFIDQIISDIHKKQSDQIGQITVLVEPFSILNQMLEKKNQIVIIAEDMIKRKNNVKIIPVTTVQTALIFSEFLFPDGNTPKSIQDFQGKPFLLFGGDNATDDYKKTVLEFCRGRGLKPKFKAVESREKVTREILVGHGYTLGSLISCEIKTVRVFKVFPLDLASNLCVAYHKDNLSHVKEFANSLKHFFPKIIEE